MWWLPATDCRIRKKRKTNCLVFRQRMKGSHSQVFAIVGVFIHAIICWRINTAENKQSTGVLERIHDIFLTQVVEKPAREGAMLDLIVTNRKGLVWDINTRDTFGLSDHEKVEFKMLEGRNQAKIRITTLFFWRADFGLLRNLLRRIP